ncbi:hypothetical protein CWS43_16280 [Rahnella sp. AA]|uniref:DUF1493 family protein n=1 Tax=Rahnella sp. AA TaxID=2057180 RepID=UPI000C3336E2|nr:DUF1493 family protein [Rahnella sp. AA]PKE29594.1 hypothetical protein CWS43_16280 [Rahnella sp. AA]
MEVDENEILQYITEKYSERRKPVRKDWTFQEHFNLVTDELGEMLIDLFTRYGISYDNFNLDNYFEPELPWWWFRLRRQYKEKMYKPLTVEMIIESAKAGKWLYD